MKPRTEDIASNALIGALLLLAVALTGLAMQGEAQSTGTVQRIGTDGQQVIPAKAGTQEQHTGACSECNAHPPFNAGYELPKDMKAAEPIATF